ncbi:MAG: hypothetical protein RLZZ437_26 [Pseudomonadota bacterium]|jgi:hypothetical protein
MSKEQWEMKPGKGLGYLGFGMNQLDAKAFDHLYGNSVNTKTYGKSADTILENLGPFANFFSDAVKTLALDDTNKFDTETAGLVEETRNPGCYLRLDYWHGNLRAFTVDMDCIELRIQDFYIFNTEPRNTLFFLQQLNGRAIANEFDVIYEKLGIRLTAFHYQNASGAWRYFTNTDDFFGARFVTLFDPENVEKYLDRNFIEVDFTTR